MAVTSRAGKASHLGDAVGLSDAELLEMFRLVALARAVDERMWILNRAGRIPFVISGQGHEGAQAAIAWNGILPTLIGRPCSSHCCWVSPIEAISGRQ